MALNVDNEVGELVRDPHKHKERYLKWNKDIKGISEKNKEIILEYLKDMEIGKNVTVSKGCRSYVRLNSLRYRMKKIAELFDKHFNKNLTDLGEEEVALLFKRMREGIIKRDDGRQYISTVDYVKVFKAFWHWYQKSMKKKKVMIDDITEDLDTSRRKPKFVYFPFEEFKRMAEHAKYNYRVLMWFLIDSGIRAPTELMNVKVKDLTFLPNSDTFQLNIRDETSKTFGRKIKLLLCSQILQEYIKSKEIKPEDFIFNISPPSTNKYLNRLGERILGKKGITMYDFRHSSACYWLPRYKSESALKYRFGWKKSEMIHYYTELLGMKDTIEEEDLYVDVTKTELEKQLEGQNKQMIILQEQLEEMQKQRNIDFGMMMKFIKSGQVSKEQFEENIPLFENIAQSMNSN